MSGESDWEGWDGGEVKALAGLSAMATIASREKGYGVRICGLG